MFIFAKRTGGSISCLAQKQLFGRVSKNLRSNGFARHVALVFVESSSVPEDAKHEMRNSEIHHYVL